MRFEKCVSLALCLHCIKSMFLGSQWSLMEAEEGFFLHSEYKGTTGFLSDLVPLSGIWSELETDCWLMYTDVPKRLTYLDYASYMCLAHLTDDKTIVGCGIRMYFSSRHVLLFYVYYSSSSRVWSLFQECAECIPLLQSVAKAPFSKCLGAAFKKSAIEGTQAIGNPWCIKSVAFCILLLS